jgi:hypothetical protein
MKYGDKIYYNSCWAEDENNFEGTAIALRR